jgi:ubiquitin C-terminal hydrolase
MVISTLMSDLFNNIHILSISNESETNINSDLESNHNDSESDNESDKSNNSGETDDLNNVSVKSDTESVKSDTESVKSDTESVKLDTESVKSNNESANESENESNNESENESENESDNESDNDIESKLNIKSKLNIESSIAKSLQSNNETHNKPLNIGISKYNNKDGVSCYMTSILHILQQIPDFVDFVMSKEISSKFSLKKDTIIFQLNRLFTVSYDNNNSTITPRSFKELIGSKNSMWSEHEHQDSQELLTFLISVLEEELGSEIENVPNLDSQETIFNDLANKYILQTQKKDYSIIKELFIGIHNSTITCSECSSISPSFESFMVVPLCIQITPETKPDDEYELYECLDYLGTDEILDINNMLLCDKCNKNNQSKKKMLFWKSPNILIFQINRFVTNKFGINIGKIINPVKYPEELDIEKYFHEESPYKTNSKYKLLGINIHQEIGRCNINAGHYVSIVKNRSDNKWYLFNDSNMPKEKTKEEIQDKNAYLLFYVKS